LNYKGIIFLGLIAVDQEPFVIEYNVRWGDPETQSILPRLQCDFLELLVACGNGTLDEVDLKIDPKTSATVVLASGGYPMAYEKGKEIRITGQSPHSQLFFAGVKEQNGHFVTSGGRVLGVNAMAPSLNEALRIVYSQIDGIHFDKKYFRRDIGYDLQ